MQRDEAIKYNSLYQEVLLAISNIKNLGFDVSEFENSLKTIHNDVNNNVKVNYVKGMAEASYIQSYATGINELNKLKIKLDNYDVYASAYNTCSYISMLLNDSISRRELEKCISKMIAVLKSISKSRTIDYDDEKSIIEKIYETAYNVIKLEIMMTGESQLYLFVKNGDTNISYFNNLIIKDIEVIDLQNEKNRKLKTKMFELGQNGIYSNYLDLELIKLIMVINNGDNLKEIVISNVNKLCVEISENVKSILSKESLIENKANNKDDIKEKLARYTKSLKRRIVSLALSMSLITLGGFQVPKLAKTASEIGGYYRKTEIVTVDGNEYSKTAKDTKYDEYKEPEVVARLIPIIDLENNSVSSSDYYEYDISNVKFDSIQEYYDYAREIYESDLVDHTLEIQKTSYDFVKPLNLMMISCYVLYMIILVLLNIASTIRFKKEVPDTSWFEYIKIKEIKRLLEKIKMEKANLAEVTDELNELITVAMEEINRDQTLRNRFNDLYEENKFLLENPEELYNRINNLEEINRVQDVKRLIREKK